MANKNLTIPEEMAFDELAIDNAVGNPTILGYMSEMGYAEPRLLIGKALLTRAKTLVRQQGNEYSDQYSSTDSRGEAFDAANKAYMTQLKLARVVIKNRGDRDRLQLDGDRQQKYPEWKDQVGQFYDNVLGTPALLTKLLDVNLTQAKLESAYALVKAVEAARQSQSTERGQAQDATTERDQALNELHAWMSDFIAVAHVALEDHPQLLEALGILARSGPARKPAVPPAPPTP